MKRSENEARSEMFTGDFTDRTTIAALLANLPRDWEGRFGKATFSLPGREPFAHRLKIMKRVMEDTGLELQTTWVHVFDLYICRFFRKLALCNTPDTYSTLMEEFQHSCDAEVAKMGDLVGFFVPMNWDEHRDENLPRRHPFSVLGRKIHSENFMLSVDAAFRDQFAKVINAERRARRLADLNSHNFYRALEAMRRNCSVYLTITRKKTPGLYRIGPEEWLSEMVCVFPFAIPMIAGGPNCVFTDGTFSILSPMVLELLCCVVANESVVVGCCVTPTETSDSFKSMWDRISDELREDGRDPELLKKIPLVSDQGSGLAKLASDYGLNWKLCHRHMIEKFGSRTILGSWVARLLRCCSDDEYLAERAVIQNEFEEVQPWKRFPDKWPLFQHLMKADGDPNLLPFAYHPDRWMRSRRPGCPSTTNGIESIHRWLNALKHSRETFMSRLNKVIEYCHERYMHRNDPGRRERRASNQHWKSLDDKPAPLATSARDTGRAEFYRALNTNEQLYHNGQGIMGWEFPEHDLTIYERRNRERRITREYTEEQVLPPQFLGKRASERPPVQFTDPLSLALGEFGVDDAIASEGETLTNFNPFHDTTWRIVFTVRALCQHQKKFAENWTPIITEVAAIGARMSAGREGGFIPKEEMHLPENEAKWRIAVYKEYGILK
jgi:hypothetical protein